MPNFSAQIRGEPEPRGFRFDVEENALYTDIEVENKLGGMEDQRQLKITETTAQQDPQAMMYWEQTAVYRQAYQLCESEGISFEEAFEKATLAAEANGQPYVPPASERPWVDKSDPIVSDPGPDLSGFDDEGAPGADPMAAVALTSYQMLTGMLLVLIDQHISEDDKDYALVEYCKQEKEKIDGYEIVI